MRASRDGSLIRDKGGVVIGINLGADYVSEHEWGSRILKAIWELMRQMG